MSRGAKGTALTDGERRLLWGLYQKFGEPRVAEMIGINRQTFARALAGLPIYNGSIALIQIGLKKLGPQLTIVGQETGTE